MNSIGGTLAFMIPTYHILLDAFEKIEIWLTIEYEKYTILPFDVQIAGGTATILSCPTTLPFL